ncbi:MAG: BamA/TamA family outer membrane protein [Bryobacteraceae bacterium]
MRLLVSICVGFFAIWHAAALQAADSVTLTLKLHEGRLAPERIEFSSNERPELSAAIHQYFNQLPKLFQLALASETDPDAEEVRNLSGDWTEAMEKFVLWTQTGDRQPAEAVFQNVLGRIHEALMFDPELLDLSSPSVKFEVVAIETNELDIEFPAMGDERKRTERQNRIRERLRKLDGSLWCDACIRREIEDFYAPMNLPVEAIPARPRRITIREGARIASIRIACDIESGEARKILWNLLSDDRFRQAERLKNLTCDGAQEERVFDYMEDLGFAKLTEPYLIASRLQLAQLALAQLGATVSVVPNRTRRDDDETPSGQEYRDLLIKRIDKEDPPPGERPKPAPVESDVRGLLGQDRQIPRQQTPGTDLGGGERDGALRERTRFVGGGVEYRPGQTLRLFGLGQQTRLPWPFGNGALSVKGSFPDGSLGAVNYFADYIGFSTLRRRLALRLNASSELQRKRFLGGRNLDEKRSGGLGRLEFEPFRDLAGAQLQIFGEATRGTVETYSNTAVAAKLNLTRLDTGARVFYRSMESEYPVRLSFEPRIRWGLGLSATETPFRVFQFTGRYHQALRGRYALDFGGRVEMAGKDTPLVELPSFGGADVVRGFRADDALGRRLWSVQNELWMPLPFDAGPLRRLRLAVFGDAGGAWQTRDSLPGMRWGAGAGLRLDMDLVVLKLDWAYGFGPAATGGSRGKFYLSFESSVPVN